MTDPRIAALAEALRSEAALIRKAGADPDITEIAAAAILATLPPDWCGHEAEIARMRADFLDDTNRRATEAHRGMGELEAEIDRLTAALADTTNELRAWESGEREARLRRIEEAARKFMDEEIGWIGDRPYYVYAGRPAVATVDALRAALGEKP